MTGVKSLRFPARRPRRPGRAGLLTTSAAAPRGPCPWTARPAAPPKGFPGCSARSTAATRGAASGTDVRLRGATPPRPYLSLHPRGQGLHGLLLLVLQLERLHQPGGNTTGPCRLPDSEDTWGGGTGHAGQGWGTELRTAAPQTDAGPCHSGQVSPLLPPNYFLL